MSQQAETGVSEGVPVNIGAPAGPLADPCPHRFCEYRECGVCIDGMRSNAKYCGPDHKAAEARLRKHDAPGTTYPVGKPYENVRRLLRRPTRDGHGTRLYVVGGDLDVIRKLLAGEAVPSTHPFRQRLEAKIPAALERIERRAAA